MWRAALLLVVAGCTHSQHGSAGDGPPQGGAFTIAGTVTGLAGNGLVLQDDHGDDLSIASDGVFTFATPIPYGSRYDVAVIHQPNNPSQTCIVANGSGTTLADVDDVQVTCATASFAIGGTITGLVNVGLVLHDGSTGEDLSVASDVTTFSFMKPVPSGTAYSITVGAQPIGQICSVSGGTGTIDNSDVTNVVVTCGSNIDPGIQCGAAFCNPATEGCCDPTGTAVCSSAAACGSLWLPCDDDADCPSGKVCCAVETTTHNRIKSASCADPGACTSSGVDLVLCDPNNPMCPSGTCKPFALLTGYYACQ